LQTSGPASVAVPAVLCQGGNPAVVMAGTVKYLHISDASRAAFASLQPVAFFPFKLLLPVVQTSLLLLLQLYMDQLMFDRIRDSFMAPVVVHFLLGFLVSLLLPIKLHSLGPTVMFIIHDDTVPLATTTKVSVKVFVVAAKVEAPHVEATAVSVSFQFLDLFQPSVLLQLQHRGACCR
jgi:hypothetical protein